MPVTVRRNFPRLDTIPLTDTALMREIGLLARERIYRRTLAGRDMRDQTFKPYSAAYAAQKQREVGGPGTVNLQLSGGMLNAIQILEVTATTVRLGFVR